MYRSTDYVVQHRVYDGGPWIDNTWSKDLAEAQRSRDFMIENHSELEFRIEEIVTIKKVVG